jgi:hypothetical protein
MSEEAKRFQDSIVNGDNPHALKKTGWTTPLVEYPIAVTGLDDAVATVMAPVAEKLPPWLLESMDQLAQESAVFDDALIWTGGGALGQAMFRNGIRKSVKKALKEAAETGANEARRFIADEVGSTTGVDGLVSLAGDKLLKAGTPGRVVRNALMPHEYSFALDIAAFRGGELVGNLTRSAPGIDATLDGVPISLKETTGGLGAVLKHASKAEASASNAGFSGVELFIKAPNIQSIETLSDFARNGPLTQIPQQGTISSINIQTAAGWYRIPGG